MKREENQQQSVTNTRTAAVIATYEPDESLLGLVESLKAANARLFIVDDGSASPEAASLLVGLAGLGATVIRKPENSGIGSSLRIGTEAALSADFQYVLTMDQDSSIGPEYLEIARDAMDRLQASGLKVGLIAPGKNSGVSVRGLGLEREGIAEVKFPIQSGCLFSADALRATGPFRDNFIMDSVDHDYALRLRKAGFRTYAAVNLDLAHNLGYPKQRRFLGRKVTVLNHSGDRQYYQFRNRVVLLKEYWRSDPSWTRTLAYEHLRSLVRVLAFEDDRWLKARRIARATAAGFRGETGRR